MLPWSLATTERGSRISRGKSTAADWTSGSDASWLEGFILGIHGREMMESKGGKWGRSRAARRLRNCEPDLFPMRP